MLLEAGAVVLTPGLREELSEAKGVRDGAREGVPPAAEAVAASSGEGVASGAVGEAEDDVLLKTLGEGSAEGEAVESAFVDEAVLDTVAPFRGEGVDPSPQLALARPEYVGRLTEGVARGEGVTKVLPDTLRLREFRGDRDVRAEALRCAVRVCDRDGVALTLGEVEGLRDVEGVEEMTEQRVGVTETVASEALSAADADTVRVLLTVGLSGGVPDAEALRVSVAVLRMEALAALVRLGLGEGTEDGVRDGEALTLALAKVDCEKVAAALAVAGSLAVYEALGVAEEELLAPSPRDGDAEAEAAVLALPWVVSVGVAAALGLGMLDSVALAEDSDEGLSANDGLPEPVAKAVVVPDRLAECDCEEQGEAEAEALPGAKLELPEESGAEALPLRDRLADMLSVLLAEGERVGSRGEALAGPVGAAELLTVTWGLPLLATLAEPAPPLEGVTLPEPAWDTLALRLSNSAGEGVLAPEAVLVAVLAALALAEALWRLERLGSEEALRPEKEA
jgi:hypothetical protein